MIGYYDNIVFEVSDELARTFNNLTMESSARYANHEVIGKKPVSEFLGVELETVSFELKLSAALGLKPRDEIESWKTKLWKGTAGILWIGPKRVGENLWVVKSLSEAWNVIWKMGDLYSANLNVTLGEYVERIKK